MGTIARHAGAPFANGEVLDGTTDLEFDINAIVSEVNGNLDNSNIKTGANIAGSKLLAASVTATQMENSTVTVAKMAAAAVPKHAVSIVTSYGALATNASLADFTGVTAATLTPGSTSDMIMMDLTFHMDPAASPAISETVTIGWSVDGTDYDDVIVHDIPSAGSQNVIVHSSYAILAPSASSIIIKPRYKKDGTKTTTIGHLIFRCFILPGK